MAKKERKPVTWGDYLLFYFSIFAGFFLLLSCLPVVAWRFNKVDTNVGNRFVMARYYYLFSTTDSFGKSIGWGSLAKKFKTKAEEFGRPSPMTAIAGTISQTLGAGGATMGCQAWEVCKQHVQARAGWYRTVYMTGIFCFLMIMISALCCAGVVLLQSFEDVKDDKKKKKKKHDDNRLTPKGRTMTCSMFAFTLSFMGVIAFSMTLDKMLKAMKQTAYYPYAAAYAGAYIGGFGVFLNFICMCITIQKVRKQNKELLEGEGEDYADFVPDPNAYGGYGEYPPQQGGYPPQQGYPQGGYGGQPGYGGYGQQGQQQGAW